GLRNRLLRGATDFYERLEGLLKDQDDPESRATLGKAYHELGTLTKKIGDLRGTLAAHQKALAVRRGVAAPADARSDAALDVARTLIEVGGVRLDQGDRDGASASLKEALAVAEQVESRCGPSEASRLVRATSYRRLLYCFDIVDQIDEYNATTQQARGLLQA